MIGLLSDQTLIKLKNTGITTLLLLVIKGYITAWKGLLSTTVMEVAECLICVASNIDNGLSMIAAA